MALLYIGTQGNGPGQGIFAADLDEATGALTLLGLVAEVARPTWVLADPEAARLYAVSELGNAGDREGEVLSFAADGALELLGRVASGGGGATHLALTDDALFVANFGGGQAAVVPLASDGTPSPALPGPQHQGSGPHRRQTVPHPHGVTLDPSGEYLLVPDMGCDRIYVHRYDPASYALTPADPPFVSLPAGSGPRLVLFGADGRFAHLLTELSAELFVFRWEGGVLVQIGHAALDPAGSGYEHSAAAITVSRDGRHLYASNRATGEMLVFAIDAGTGLLTGIQRLPAGGDKPWCAEISPNGRWLLVANQASDLLTLFAIDTATGLLTRAAGELTVPSPTSIAFMGR